MAQFIGLPVVVTLLKPHKDRIEGFVKDVGAGQQLTLGNATNQRTGNFHPLLAIPAASIGNLEIIAVGKALEHSAVADPAIVSFDRATASSGAAKKIQKNAESKPEISATAATLHAPFVELSFSEAKASSKPSTPHVKDLKVENMKPEIVTPGTTDLGGTQAKKSVKRGRRSRRPALHLSEAQHVPQYDEQGMRSSPLTTHLEFPVQNIPGKGRRRDRAARKDETNGWATGDASDIQDMGEFDFESNLSKFNKRKVFDEIRAGDTTADEDRLHNVNRIAPRLGTAGGKNLHHTENVLDAPKSSLLEHSSADDEVEASQFNISRRGSERKAQLRKQTPSRQGSSGFISDRLHQPSAQPPVLQHSSNPYKSAVGPIPDLRPGRPLSALSQTNSSRAVTRPTSRSHRPVAKARQPYFRFQKSQLPCPMISPLQQMEMESISQTDFHLADNVLHENAGRSIAEVCVQIYTASVQPHKTVDKSKASVCIFASNTRSGARAIAAGRHLLNRQYKVTLILLTEDETTDLTSATDLVDAVRQQCLMYRDCGGILVTVNKFLEGMQDALIEPDLVLDAIFGLHSTFDALTFKLQGNVARLLLWARRNSMRPFVSLDMPCGMHASTGMPGDEEPARFGELTKYVVCLGAPKSGLGCGDAYESGKAGAYKIIVADIGLPEQVWRKVGRRGKQGMQFEDEWISQIEFAD